PTYNKIHKDMEGLIKRVPWYGFRVYRAAKKLEESMKGMLIPGMLFEELGLRYIGPIDGNNLEGMIKTIDGALRLEGPILIHALTKKGKGYHHAEKHPEKFHGTAPFDIETGELKAPGASSAKSFTETFSESLVEIAGNNPKVAAVTAAMPEGTGLDAFQKEYPGRFFNVGMAEQHAVTFAAGLAKGGVVPVVAIYSTFMQRSYDQIIHDACLQNLHVVFCLDRAGIVGEDGATHHGIFDIAFMRHMPNMTLLAPKDQAELKGMLEYAVNRCEGPVALRYPRGKIVAPPVLETDTPIVRGKAEVMSKEGELAILAVGSMVWPACAAAGLLFSEGIKTSLVNVRFIKPFDEDLLRSLAARTKKFVTIEEGVLEGGFGSAVLEFFEREKMSDISVKRLGFPAKFVEHGRKEDLFKAYGLDAQGIASEIKKMFSKGKAVRV
ncbi:MAG TPA: 1-deoxy-D-xylulose-5-phosphate synthase, partial [Candidatus Omnitrophota bacterium]|nr:1-deoxy-D-xylulose-5-phosphate synthase [Candidatus Omnitrophota bacterium]